METIKEEVLSALSHLPDTAAIDDYMYRLYVIDKIKKGQKAILNGEIISSEALKKEISLW